MKISGCAAIVTGGCQGIGRGIVYALLRRKAKVAVLDINDAAGIKLEKELKGEFGDGMACYAHCDVTNKDQLTDVFQNVKRKFNGLNIIVNNAGTVDLDCDVGIDVNLKSVVRGTTLGFEMMDKNSGNDGGAVINIASMSGIVPFSLAPVYTAAKAGVIAFTRCFKGASEMNGVRVNCVCPVFVKSTEMVDMGMKMSPLFKKVTETVGFVTIDLVAEAVIQTIEDESLAGKVVTVTQEGGMQTMKFPRASL